MGWEFAVALTGAMIGTWAAAAVAYWITLGYVRRRLQPPPPPTEPRAAYVDIDERHRFPPVITQTVHAVVIGPDKCTSHVAMKIDPQLVRHGLSKETECV